MDDLELNDVGSSEIPMTAQQEAEYEYTASGKSIKEPISMILKRASQGYDYSQKMNEFNQRSNEFNQRYKTYQDIDNFAQQNPQWWEHIQNSFNNRESFQSQQPQAMASQTMQTGDPRVDSLLNEFGEVKSFIQQMQSKEQQQIREQADARLKDEIEGIKKQYGNIDFSQADESGKSLEHKVMEYAVENGIKSFRTAFRDFYHDELVKRASEQSKDNIAKDMQRKTKLGLLGQTQAPTKGIAATDNVRSKSYGDLAQEALRELGL